MRCRGKSGVISLDQLRSLSRTISGSTGGRKTGSMSSSGFSSSGSFASLNLVADKRRDQEQASLVTPLKMEKQKLAAVDAHVSNSYSGISVGGVAPALSLSTRGTPKDSTCQHDSDKISEAKQAETPNPKSLLSPTVQCAPELDDPVSGPPISMPEDQKGHGTTVMGYVLPNIPSMVVQADGRAVGENNKILGDLDQDFKLVEDEDYVFGAAGDGNICADVIKEMRQILKEQRNRKKHVRATIQEIAGLVKLYFDQICPREKQKNIAFRKLHDVAILCAGFDKGKYGKIVPSMWVGTKSGAYKVERFEALGTGRMYADLEVETHKRCNTVEEVVQKFRKGVWRASVNDFHTAGKTKICIISPKTPAQVGKKKKRHEEYALGEVECHYITVKELMDMYGVFDEGLLSNQSVDESYAIAVRGKGNTSTLKNLESLKVGSEE